MPDRPNYQLKEPSDALAVSITAALRNLHKWPKTLKPKVDTAFEALKNDGYLTTIFSEALEDFGRYFVEKADEIRAERERLGITKSKKLPPAKY